MISETILTNARIVTPKAVIAGTVVVRDGLIAEVAEGNCRAPAALDCGGDHLVPGLVELHTDNLERHLSPRPGVTWPVAAALLAHDALISASGITTVFDAVAIGDVVPDSARIRSLGEMLTALRAPRLRADLRAEHFLHLRCELTYEGVVEWFDDVSRGPLVRLASLMDHTPGQRQFADWRKYRSYFQGKYGLDAAALEALIERQQAAHARHAEPNRAAVVAMSRQRGIALASHDDETPAHVAQAQAEGVSIAEFPTTRVAAEAARAAGMNILMGGPNLVLGGSQSGNISARDLLADGLLDILSSDYVPASLLEAAFLLPGAVEGITLPDAVALVSANPAELVGLSDRGAIVCGRRADLVRVNGTGPHPAVRAVWREGERVH